MVVNTINELDELLKVLRSHGVRQFNLNEMQIVLDDSEVDDDDMDEREPVSAMGFEVVNYSNLDIKTDFDE
jgi:hypothetical protein